VDRSPPPDTRYKVEFRAGSLGAIPRVYASPREVDEGSDPTALPPAAGDFSDVQESRTIDNIIHNIVCMKFIDK
jgi:hypothetical protein